MKYFLIFALLIPFMVVIPFGAGDSPKPLQVDPVAEADEEPFDLLIKNGRVLDGTGNPWFYADIAITGNRIVKIGNLNGYTAGEIVDATGLFVAPGFIDVHSHAGPGLASEELSYGQPLLAQGITTVIINPDGGGALDMAEQREQLQEHGLGVNVAQLIPHGTIRREVIGLENRPPSETELKEMKRLVEIGMEEGAFGLSSGLFYAPGIFAGTEEMIKLAKVVAEYGGVYSSHIRDESDYDMGLIASVEEVIRIARQAKLRGIVTHIKALGTGVWGFSAPVIHRIERAREEGVEVFADQYPYTASFTNLTAALVPAWARDGGRNVMLERFSQDDTLEEIKREMEENLVRRGGPDRIQIARFAPDTTLEGRLLSGVAEILEQDPIDAALTLIRAQNPGIVSFNMHDEDVHRFMRQPWTMTGSDGGLVELGKGVVHPRNYGAFPRKIAKYVREDRIVDLPFAIRSMTSLPASVHGMQNRGLLHADNVADIIIFDLEATRDLATFEEPHKLSEGMVHVLVNGKFAVKDESFLPDLHGIVLRKNKGNEVSE